MKLIIILVMLALSVVHLFSGEPVILENLSKPRQFIIHGDRLWVAGEKTVQQYSLKDGSLIRQFGRQGQGPKEFIEPPSVYLTSKNKVLVYTPLKMIFFNQDGSYIGEKKFPKIFSMMSPLGDNYVARTLKLQAKAREYIYVISLYDQELNPIRELSREAFANPMQHIDVVFFNRKFVVYHDRLYIPKPDNDGFAIDVFDLEGRSLQSITKKYEKIRVPDEYITEKKSAIKAEKAAYWHLIKDTLHFPRYFPAVQDMTIDKERIYIKTWVEKHETVQFFIMDIQGKTLKTICLPETGSLYTIAAGFYYYLIDNPDKEAWELHRTKL